MKDFYIDDWKIITLPNNSKHYQIILQLKVS